MAGGRPEKSGAGRCAGLARGGGRFCAGPRGAGDAPRSAACRAATPGGGGSGGMKFGIGSGGGGLGVALRGIRLR